MEDFLFKLLEVLAPLLLAALTWASARGAQLISAKVKSEYFQGVLLRLNDGVLAAVREVEQVLVSELKAAHADGKLTEQEKMRVKRVALTTVKSYLGAKGLAELARILGLGGEALDKFLGGRIEATVNALKAEPKPIKGEILTSASREGAAAAPLPSVA